MQHSPEQLAFFDALTQTQDNLLLEACAGSGKTTTIVDACKRLGTGYSIRFLAFNKDIATELTKRLPFNAEASTFHSAGYRALIDGAKANGARFPVKEDNKSRKALEAHLSKREFFQVATSVCKGVSFLKSVGAGTHLRENSVEASIETFKHYDLEVPEETTLPRVATIATKLLDKVASDLSCIDYDDMVYLPLRHRLRFQPVNVVFVDEAQDTNAVRCELLKQMIFPRPLGRVVAVGDPHQAIYGFNGADANALENLATTFSMRKLPLSVSWRCSQAVVAEARRALGYVPAQAEPRQEAALTL